jgi:hypothetical protein
MSRLQREMGAWRECVGQEQQSMLQRSQKSSNEQSSTHTNQCPNSHCHKRAFSPGNEPTREDKPRGRILWKVCSDSGFSSVLGKSREISTRWTNPHCASSACSVIQGPRKHCCSHPLFAYTHRVTAKVVQCWWACTACRGGAACSALV